PAFLFNIGQCHRQLGHVQDAITFYRAYLRNLPNADNRDEVKELVSKLEQTAAAESATKKAPPQEPREPSGVRATTPTPSALPRPWARPWAPLDTSEAFRGRQLKTT